MMRTNPPKDRIKIFNARLLNWSKQFYRDFAWRTNRTPYKIFIAEVLLKRTTSKAASKIFEQFIEKYPSISELEHANEKELEVIFKPVGLYKQRSSVIKKSTTYLIDSFNGNFPDTFEDLIKIPSIGPYSAACILSFGMNIPIPTIDSNGIRVFSRVFQNNLGDKPSFNETLKFSFDTFPKKFHVNFNYGLIDFGALVCSYRGCKGNQCPLRNICDFFLKGKTQYFFSGG